MNDCLNHSEIRNGKPAPRRNPDDSHSTCTSSRRTKLGFPPDSINSSMVNVDIGLGRYEVATTVDQDSGAGFITEMAASCQYSDSNGCLYVCRSVFKVLR